MYNSKKLVNNQTKHSSLSFRLSWQVLNQEETPLLYSLVFGEGVVNDATSVVLFNAIQRFDLSHITSINVLQFIGSFLYLFFTSTVLGVAVSLSLSFSLSLCGVCAHLLQLLTLPLCCNIRSAILFCFAFLCGNMIYELSFFMLLRPFSSSP